MRLYLSSYQLGAHAEQLAAMVGKGGRGWVIMNALDGMDESRRQRDIGHQILRLAEIGLVGADLDLRDHDRSTIAAAFGEPDFVWVRGGNVFTLRAAMAQSGLDDLIVRHIRKDSLVYAGFSAGACVLAPSLSGLEPCDPLDVCESTYGRVITGGLGILDRPLVPHLDSPSHPETDILAEVAESYRSAGQPYWALRDGQALVHRDGKTAIV